MTTQGGSGAGGGPLSSPALACQPRPLAPAPSRGPPARRARTCPPPASRSASWRPRRGAQCQPPTRTLQLGSSQPPAEALTPAERARPWPRPQRRSCCAASSGTGRQPARLVEGSHLHHEALL
eukprot:CAMPEP_0168493670 /NCGR_PEP_ID=MMETSP0228-20121227/70838_1 /TAXON_ID=133427 /ORGANISM="Protoceratium reticulatum, Strain CCCM 535 (=CCMP 1889)" /LENGTH=122 /DNA_ID=CAMNT_0008510459 /DNA_START=57 /DNA_END=421 /DNA_ORIENTATION=-